MYKREVLEAQNPPVERPGETFEEVVSQRVGRRTVLTALLGFGAAAAQGALDVTKKEPVTERVDNIYGIQREAGNGESLARDYRLTMRGISQAKDDFINVPPGYRVNLVIKWGDPMFSDAPMFDFRNQTAAAQKAQFGYNADFIAYMPLPRYDVGNSREALMLVNHEYTNPELMFEGYVGNSPTRQQVEVQLEAHGASIIEVRQDSRGWYYDSTSKYNRRITATTPMEVTGPAAGHRLMRTSADSSGARVNGMLNNCGGGKTPWGTVLTAEENFHQYFSNRNALPDGEVKTAHTRYGVPSGNSEYRWSQVVDRFDVVKEPNEPFRFGYVVEIDPYDPNYVPKKRTALGRTKHEAATCVVASDGRVAIYSGDDERFEYLYKFVTEGKYNPNDRSANVNLLDRGTLYVAKFNPDGTGEWLALVQGRGPLTAANGFSDQGDVCIKTRTAADLLGATKMDRPEDVEANPVNGKIYMACTNNTNRGVGSNPGTDPANPRPANRAGHIIEITENDANHAATSFTWEILVLCGIPGDARYEPTYFGGFDKRMVSSIGAPDNVAIDRRGNLWIATDGQPSAIGWNDGIFAMPVDGPDRGYLRQLLSAPNGAEVCGPEFTPDDTTLFCAIQHPGEGGTLSGPVVSTWPDGPGQPPKSAVLALMKEPGSSSPLIGN